MKANDSGECAICEYMARIAKSDMGGNEISVFLVTVMCGVVEQLCGTASQTRSGSELFTHQDDQRYYEMVSQPIARRL